MNNQWLIDEENARAKAEVQKTITEFLVTAKMLRVGVMPQTVLLGCTDSTYFRIKRGGSAPSAQVYESARRGVEIMRIARDRGILPASSLSLDVQQTVVGNLSSIASES